MNKATIYVYNGTVCDSEDRMRNLLEREFNEKARTSELYIGDGESLEVLEKLVELMKLHKNVGSLKKEITL